MDYQEAIENHINECRRRIDFIKNHMNTNAYANKDRCCENIQVMETAISAMQELQELHDQGFSLDRMKDIDFRKEIVEHINYDAYMGLMDELEEYKQLGTLEEVREAVEKQKAKKPILDKPLMILECHSCGNFLQKVVDNEGSTKGFIPNYCRDCGQKIDADWSDE